MVRLLLLVLVLALWSLTVAAPTKSTEEHKGIVYPKKVKINATAKTEGPTTNPGDQTTMYLGNINSTEPATEGGSSPTGIPPSTVHEEFVQSETGQEEMLEESDPTEEPVYGREIIPGYPLPPDANDGLIEYNLGNPLALKLHLPWWPLKDMLRSIQDAISVMNLTTSGEIPEADNTKIKIVQFDDRNYTLKVKIFQPHENNRLLVRLISLTPVIEEGKMPTEKVLKVEGEEHNKALKESETKTYSQMKKMDDERSEEEKDDDDDDKDKKEQKKKPKDVKKEKQNKKKREEKKGSDSEGSSD